MASFGPVVLIVLIVLITAVVGAVLAVIKGRDYGLGYFIGNLSAPYLVTAFFAGRFVRNRLMACAMGVLATWATLTGFYLSAEWVYGYPTGSMTRFYAEWFLAGILSGTSMGMLGSESRRRVVLVFVLPFALVLEPFAVIAVQSAGRFGGLALQPLQLLVWAGESLVGLLLAALAALAARLRRRVDGHAGAFSG